MAGLIKCNKPSLMVVVGQAVDQSYYQIRDQVRKQVQDQVYNQALDQVWNQVRDIIWNQVGDQVVRNWWKYDFPERTIG